ncbi:hypothetical protein SRHO_G00303680 [Serrasalmus rhombeus]
MTGTWKRSHPDSEVQSEQKQGQQEKDRRDENTFGKVCALLFFLGSAEVRPRFVLLRLPPGRSHLKPRFGPRGCGAESAIVAA